MSLGTSYAALVIGGAFCAPIVGVVWRLMGADRLESEKSASRAPSLKAVLLGRARFQDDTMPDARVQAGLICNVKANRMEISGRVARESLGHIFHR